MFEKVWGWFQEHYYIMLLTLAFLFSLPFLIVWILFFNFEFSFYDLAIYGDIVLILFVIMRIPYGC